MDKTDQQVLTILRKNPKKPFLKIAKEIGISTNTVKKRYEKMKRDNIISGTSLILDLAKIGYQGKAFLLVTNSKSYDSTMTVKVLKKIPNVFLVAEIVGAFDVLVIVVFRNMKEIREIIRQIRAHPSIKKVEVAFTDDTYFFLKKEHDNIRLFGSETMDNP